MKEYEHIASVIEYLETSCNERPDPTVLAKQAGLSPALFHQLFISWGGVEPSDFMQGLAGFHTRHKLQEGKRALDAARFSDLSATGRQALCVKLKVASPTEARSFGEGEAIWAGYTETPFGACLVAEKSGGICHFAFIDGQDNISAWNQLQACWPEARLERDDSRAVELGERIFRREIRNIRSSDPSTEEPFFHVYVKGSEFQVRVWQALLHVPPGTLVSYRQLAAFLGNPNASRAVGSALGRNPVAYLIPCHRVIRESGAIGGYHWGIARKKMIQLWESLCER